MSNNASKYIIVTDGNEQGDEWAITFHKELIHADVAIPYRNRGNGFSVVAAGFFDLVNHIDGTVTVRAGGKSESLNIVSRGFKDAEIIAMSLDPMISCNIEAEEGDPRMW